MVYNKQTSCLDGFDSNLLSVNPMKAHTHTHTHTHTYTHVVSWLSK